MKRLFLALLVMCLTIAACQKDNESKCECGKVEINKKEYIAMCILPYEVSINSVNKLRIENHTKEDMFYAGPFPLEYFNKNKWEYIQFDSGNVNYMVVEYNLPTGKTTKEVMNLYSLAEKYNDSKKGKYRIVQQIYTKEEEYKSYSLYAEFEIK
jgi:hypothetical protein